MANSKRYRSNRLETVNLILDTRFKHTEHYSISSIQHQVTSIYPTFANMIISQNLKLETDKVILRPMQQEDISSFARITNDASVWRLSLIHISEPTRLLSISYAVFCLKK